MQSLIRSVSLLLVFAVAAPFASAQQVVTTVPFQNLNDSFYERTGVNWSLRGPNFFANFGGPPLLPAFGGADPNCRFARRCWIPRGGLSGSLGFSFAQGSNRSSVSTAPSVTTMNGVPGTISSQTISPFVTGITPVVGGYSYGNPTQDNVSNQMFQSHQASQAAYLQSRLNANAKAKQERANVAFERAVRADEQGNLRMARANYRIALGSDQGVLRQQILMRMKEHGWTK